MNFDVKQVVIGLSGKMGAGKDETAKILIRKYGFVRFAFGDLLKQEVSDYLTWKPTEDDFPTEIVEIMEMYAGDADAPFRKPTSKAMRRLLQWWGTEYRRAQDPHYWVKKLIADEAFQEALRDGIPIVITDVRFPNEKAFIETFHFGRAVYVVGAFQKVDYDPSLKTHASESMDSSMFRTILFNDGTLEDLENLVDAILSFSQIVPVRQGQLGVSYSE